MHTPESSAAFAELLDLLREGERNFLEGDRAVVDEVTAAEGYGWLTTTLQVALDCYLWADAARPEFIELTSPTKRWGGDNSDAAYWYAPIDHARRYHIWGEAVDCAYLSITVYGGPDDGRWSSRIVTTVNDESLGVDRNGTFELLLGPTDPDAVAIVTRDYHLHPKAEGRSTFHIECLDPREDHLRATDADVARRLRQAANFLRDLYGLFPLNPPSAPNTFQDPYGVPEFTYGWAAGDAAYAMGCYELADDEALVISGTWPACRFWNLCLWNPYLQTYDYRYEQVTINGGEAVAEPDGSYRLVVSATDPGVPNWLTTAGHTSGILWFRWFLPDRTPDPLATEVVKLADL